MDDPEQARAAAVPEARGAEDAEERLDDASRLRLAQRLAQVGTWEWSLVDGENVWSDEVWPLYGCTREEGEPSYALWLACIDPRDREAAAARAREASARGESFELCWRTSPTRGPTRWLLSRGHPLHDRSGRLTRYLGIVMDVTVQRRAEEALANEREQLAAKVEHRTRELAEKERELATMLDAIPGVVGYWDRDLINRYANHAYLSWFGTPGHALSGRHLSELLPPHVFAANEPHARAALRGEPQFFERELPVLEGRGVRVMQAYYVPDVRDEEVRGFYVLGFDVTELKRAESAAEAASRAKTDFLARMSHEIRTPLHAVLGLAQLGVSGQGLAPGELFARITEAGQHLLELVNDVLDFSKIEAGRLELHEGVSELAELASRALAIVQGAATHKGIRLRVEEADHLPTSYRGDALRLEQVLINLLANAVRYTSHGSVTLALARDRDALLVEVRDTGVGMDADTLERAFRPFEQGERRLGEASGTGLGLAITRGLVELMRGSIAVDSVAGQGTCVRVRLPLHFGEAEPMYTSLSPLLLVGLPEDSAELLAAQLTRHGVRVELRDDLASPPVEAATVLVDGLVLQRASDAARRSWLEACARFVAVHEGGSHCLEVPDPACIGSVDAPLSPLRIARAALQAPSPRRKRAASKQPRLVGVRVLAAEDNAVNRLVLSEMLKAEGAECVCGEHGAAALDALRVRGPDTFDVMLCDIEMPVMDGYETARALSREAPGLPVIGLTAHAFDVARTESAAAGMVDFVTKPYMLDDLVSAIRRQLRRPGPVLDALRGLAAPASAD